MRLRISSLPFFVLLLGCVIAAQAGTEPPLQSHGALAIRLQRLLQRSGQDYRVDIRITSRSVQGDPSVAHLTATRETNPRGDRLTFSLQSDDTRRRYCLDCAQGNDVAPCDGAKSTASGTPDGMLPGTLLPWEELIVGACGTWQVSEQTTGGTRDPSSPISFDVRLPHPPDRLSWRKTVARVDPLSGLPTRFDRLDADGRLVRSVRVLEVGRIANWEGIRRAVIELPEGKVLMEVRGVSLQRPAITP